MKMRSASAHTVPPFEGLTLRLSCRYGDSNQFNIDQPFAGRSTMPTPTCPQCGTLKVRPAPRRFALDRLFAFLTVHPFRCQLCARRFRSLVGKRTPNPGRAYDRLSVKYPVWFQPRTLPAERPTFQGMIENLSIRGCRIRSHMAFPVGTQLRLEFLASHQSFPITIDSAVVRSRHDDVIGLRFVAVLHAEERRIGHILNLRLPDLEPSWTSARLIARQT